MLVNAYKRIISNVQQQALQSVSKQNNLIKHPFNELKFIAKEVISF